MAGSSRRAAGRPRGGSRAAFRRKTEVRLRLTHAPDRNNPLDQRGIPHYTLVGSLPPICLPHGRPAIDHYEATIQFEGISRITTQTRIEDYRSLAPNGMDYLRKSSEADSVVHANWAICRRCKLWIKAREFAFLFSVFAAMCLVIGLFAAAQAGLRDITVFLAFVVSFGTPVILLAITGLLTSIRPVGTVTRSPDRRHLVVQAHPRFAERLAAATESDGDVR
ncbi:hypothetical protein DFR74_106169 [Nocardia puris]|uniref:Uncharacterized protein n=1 Tax=Nocardia puris TaxID=208602 RepID=A0A366DLV8_9NOCA|nr:hypothetical protein DFR74_106169 [Nocardia puris]